MLAYTTLSDFFVLPTVLEAVVYIGGLMLVLAAPYLLLRLVDSRRTTSQPHTPVNDTPTQP